MYMGEGDTREYLTVTPSLADTPGPFRPLEATTPHKNWMGHFYQA